MRPIKPVGALLLATCLLCSATRAAGARSEPDGTTRRISTAAEALVTMGSPVAGYPEAARHDVRFGVCSAFMVIGGTVLGLTPVAVVDTEDSTHKLVSVEVQRSWKAQVDGVQRVRLMENLSQPSGGRPSYASFTAGDECLLYVVRDSLNELMGAPTSLAIRDSVILGLWGIPQQISRDDVFALVDSCVADGSLDSMACRADLIIEGDVESSWEDWLGRVGENRTACSATLAKLSVHKGSFGDSLFNLINVRGYKGWNYWPTFARGERVLLFLEDDPVAAHKLIGGWHGKWQLVDEGVFRIGTRSRRGSFGVVSPDAPVRASMAPERAFSRSQLEEALLRAVHTLSN